MNNAKSTYLNWNLIDMTLDRALMNNQMPDCSDIQRIERSIQKINMLTTSLYFNVQAVQKEINVDVDSLKALGISCEYLPEIVKMLQDKQNRCKVNVIEQPNHNRIYKYIKAGFTIMAGYYSNSPLVQINDVKHAWNNFIETSTLKLFIIFFMSLLSLIFGGLTAVNWALIVTTIVHFITRCIANKYRNRDDYIHISRNIQLLIFPYLLLAIANCLNPFVSLEGLPDNTLVTIITIGIIYSEIKGIVENAKIANLPVPTILEWLVGITKKNENL